MPKRVEAKFAYKTATRSINVTEVNKERRVLFHLMVILEWDHKLPCESFTSIARRMCRCDTSKPPFQACYMVLLFAAPSTSKFTYFSQPRLIDLSRHNLTAFVIVFGAFLWRLCVSESFRRKTISRARMPLRLSDFLRRKSFRASGRLRVDSEKSEKMMESFLSFSRSFLRDLFSGRTQSIFLKS